MKVLSTGYYSGRTFLLGTFYVFEGIVLLFPYGAALPRGAEYYRIEFVVDVLHVGEYLLPDLASGDGLALHVLRGFHVPVEERPELPGQDEGPRYYDTHLPP